MSSEQNVPEVQMHQGPTPAQMSGQMSVQVGQNGTALDAGHTVPHGMGQSKSSRRRRRKRKNKGGDAVAAPANGQSANGSGQFVGDLQAGAQGVAAPQQGFQNGSGQQPAGPATKRWKKKFRDRDRQRGGGQENPGNQAQAGGFSAPSANGGGHRDSYRDKETHQPGNNANGFKRKGGGGGGKQRGPRSFVGPMDHSYRAVNGNFAEAPPSTIETQGNYAGRSNGGGRSYVSDSQPIDYSQGRPVPIPADAPTKIFFFIEDLFFNAKITETAKKLGVKVAFVKNDKDAIAELTSHEEADRPGLIVFDLNNANVKPLTLIPKLKAKLKKSTSIVGFLSHLQGDLKAKAVEAGCDTVMPRAAFSQNLPNLLRRYGMHEEDEDNFNQ
jgi:hypothetical protein